MRLFAVVVWWMSVLHAGTALKRPVSVHARQIADTLTMTGTWIAPVTDGRGALDSLKVQAVGIFLDSTIIYRVAPFPTTLTVVQGIPPQAYGTGGSATFAVFFRLISFRRGLVTIVKSPDAVIVLADLPPPGVTGLTVSATKRP